MQRDGCSRPKAVVQREVAQRAPGRSQPPQAAHPLPARHADEVVSCLYATYDVVSYRFTGALENGKHTAACTFRRDGQWGE